MFTYFKVESEPDMYPGSTRFVITLREDSKKVTCSKIIYDEELYCEGHVDILFRDFLTYFKRQLALTPSCIECDCFYPCTHKPVKTDNCFSKASVNEK